MARYNVYRPENQWRDRNCCNITDRIAFARQANMRAAI